MKNATDYVVNLSTEGKIKVSNQEEQPHLVSEVRTILEGLRVRFIENEVNSDTSFFELDIPEE